MALDPGMLVGMYAPRQTIGPTPGPAAPAPPLPAQTPQPSNWGGQSWNLGSLWGRMTGQQWSPEQRAAWRARQAATRPAPVAQPSVNTQALANVAQAQGAAPSLPGPAGPHYAGQMGGGGGGQVTTGTGQAGSQVSIRGPVAEIRQLFAGATAAPQQDNPSMAGAPVGAQPPALPGLPGPHYSAQMGAVAAPQAALSSAAEAVLARIRAGLIQVPLGMDPVAYAALVAMQSVMADPAGGGGALVRTDPMPGFVRLDPYA